MTLDVTQEYYEKSLKYMIYGNVMRNNCYPISVSSERIFQAIAIARYANEIGAHAIAHGSTGAGNDQIRFDMTFLVMAPGVEIITLTRDKALSRQEEVDYLNAHATMPTSPSSSTLTTWVYGEPASAEVNCSTLHRACPKRRFSST